MSRRCSMVPGCCGVFHRKWLELFAPELYIRSLANVLTMYRALQPARLSCGGNRASKQYTIEYLSPASGACAKVGSRRPFLQCLWAHRACRACHSRGQSNSTLSGGYLGGQEHVRHRGVTLPENGYITSSWRVSLNQLHKTRLQTYVIELVPSDETSELFALSLLRFSWTPGLFS